MKKVLVSVLSALFSGVLFSSAALAAPNPQVTRLADPLDVRDDCLSGKTCYDLHITLKNFRIGHRNEKTDEPYMMPFYGLVDGTVLHHEDNTEADLVRVLTVDKTHYNLGIKKRKSSNIVNYSTWNASEVGRGWTQNQNGLWVASHSGIDIEGAVNRFYFKRTVHPIDGYDFGRGEGVIVSGFMLEKDGSKTSTINSRYSNATSSYFEAVNRDLRARISTPTGTLDTQQMADDYKSVLGDLAGCTLALDIKCILGTFVQGSDEFIRFYTSDEDDKVGSFYDFVEFRDLIDRPYGVDVTLNHLFQFRGSYEATVNFRLVERQRYEEPDIYCQEYPKLGTYQITSVLNGNVVTNQPVTNLSQVKSWEAKRRAAQIPYAQTGWSHLDVFVLGENGLNKIVALSPREGRRQHGEYWNWLTEGDNRDNRHSSVDNVFVGKNYCNLGGYNDSRSMQFEMIPVGRASQNTYALRSVHNGKYLIVRSDNKIYANATSLGGDVPNALKFRFRKISD